MLLLGLNTVHVLHIMQLSEYLNILIVDLILYITQNAQLANQTHTEQMIHLTAFVTKDICTMEQAV